MEDLRDKFEKYWSVNGEAHIKTIREGYKIPSNCSEELVAPMINEKVYRTVDPYIKRRDRKIRLVQENTTQATVALIKIAEEVLKAEAHDTPIDGNEVLKHTLNAFSLMGNSCRTLTSHRRKIMSSTLPPVLQDVCNNGNIPSSSKNLFGEDLSKSLKDAQERIQLNSQLTKRKAFQHYVKPPPFKRHNQRNNNFNYNNSSSASSTITTPYQGRKPQDFRPSQYHKGRIKTRNVFFKK